MLGSLNFSFIKNIKSLFFGEAYFVDFRDNALQIPNPELHIGSQLFFQVNILFLNVLTTRQDRVVTSRFTQLSKKMKHIKQVFLTTVLKTFKMIPEEWKTNDEYL